ncbi:MAG: pteridine reductase [Rhodocyclaceae bacterium]|nr:pteridine reductase [Rhodocyclaceae bacterium]
MDESDCAPVVLVTGAARRVGAAIARRLHEDGARVCVHYRGSAEEARRLVADLERARSGSAHCVAADLSDVGAIGRLVADCVARFGRLDGLVNNASSFFATPVGATGPEAWDDLVGSNLRAPFFLCQAAAAELKERRGAIVNIVDIHAERPLEGYPVYSIAKAGMAGLTRAMAVELGPEVRVNGVSPGAIMWPDDGQFVPDERARIIATSLLKRIGSPRDIADVVAFLLFHAPYVTGQILAVDGGRSAYL